MPDEPALDARAVTRAIPPEVVLGDDLRLLLGAATETAAWKLAEALGVPVGALADGRRYLLRADLIDALGARTSPTAPPPAAVLRFPPTRKDPSR